MVDFLRKRLQVFVSSTFTDLRQERQAAVEAILTAGHIPAGMELFTSGDESQMAVIKQWIDESDVYLLILGGRYGSIEPNSGKSYTQLEYEYALKSKKPLFACVVTDKALEHRVKTEGISILETVDPASLKCFRTEVLTRMVKYWEDYKDIKIAVGETLAHFARREDLVGWVRQADKEVDMEGLLNEISRLSQENSQLREQLSGMVSEPLISGLTFHELFKLLQQKELLNTFSTSRERFIRGVYPTGLSESNLCIELACLGLLYQNNNEFFLDKDGKQFLSRLDLIMLRQGTSL